MARRPTLAETYADDTGGIRPEMADFLLEDDPAPPDFHPHQGQREILEEPGEPFSHTILFFLGMLLLSVFCLWAISYRLSLRATVEGKQVSNPATQTEEISRQTITNTTEAPPISNQEKIENEVNQVTTSKKLEEERAKSTGTEDSSSFNRNECGIRKEPSAPVINREEVEQPESKETNTASSVKEESESTRQSYQYNPPRPPRYRYSENSGNFTRRQYGYPYPYGQPHYAPPIIRYRIRVYPSPYYFGPIQGIGPHDPRLEGRRYIVVFQRRYR